MRKTVSIFEEETKNDSSTDSLASENARLRIEEEAIIEYGSRQ